MSRRQNAEALSLEPKPLPGLHRRHQNLVQGNLRRPNAANRTQVCLSRLKDEKEEGPALPKVSHGRGQGPRRGQVRAGQRHTPRPACTHSSTASLRAHLTAPSAHLLQHPFRGPSRARLYPQAFPASNTTPPGDCSSHPWTSGLNPFLNRDHQCFHTDTSTAQICPGQNEPDPDPIFPCTALLHFPSLPDSKSRVRLTFCGEEQNET